MARGVRAMLDRLISAPCPAASCPAGGRLRVLQWEWAGTGTLADAFQRIHACGSGSVRHDAGFAEWADVTRTPTHPHGTTVCTPNWSEGVWPECSPRNAAADVAPLPCACRRSGVSGHRCIPLCVTVLGCDGGCGCVRAGDLPPGSTWSAERARHRAAAASLSQLRHAAVAPGELLLWHGTARDRAASIARTGFNVKLARDGLYGQGCYFTPSPCKAHQYSDGSMLLCLVHVGRHRFVPQRHSGAAPTGCDSVIALGGFANDAAQVHTEVVVFKSARVLPLLRLTYTVV